MKEASSYFMLRKPLYIIITLIGIILISLPSNVNAHSYKFRSLSSNEGLTDLIVNSLYKDSQGYVWIGTGSTLERFDGTHLFHYKIKGANQNLKRVNTIAQTADGNIWMGNGAGLWRVDRTKNELEAIVPEHINIGVKAFAVDASNKLYIGTERGLFIYSNGNFVHQMIDNNILSSSNGITGLSLSKDNTLWITTVNGLYSYNMKNKKISSYPSIYKSFNKLCVIGNSIFLATMESGIIRFDKKTRQFTKYTDVGCNVISSLTTSSKDKNILCVGTDGNGVHFIDTNTGKIVSSLKHEIGNDGKIRSNSVYSLLVDDEGLIWVGFYQLGLDYTMYQRNIFSVYTSSFFNSEDMPIRSIEINGDEKLIGSRDGLYYMDEAAGKYKSFRSPAMRSNMVLCTNYYNGKYYIGTYGGGMYVFDSKSISLSDFNTEIADPFVRGQIFTIVSDKKKNMWIGTSNGLFCYSNNKITAHYTSDNSKLPVGNVYEIFFDSTEKGWICTENGVSIWDPSSKRLRSDIFPEGFINNEKIRKVYEDSDHNLYFLPDKGSIFMSDLKMSHFNRVNPHDMLDGKDCMFITEDDKNWLVIGTSNGLYRYDKREIMIPYNFIDGIPSSIFTYCNPVKDSNGGIWIGNSKGLLYCNLNSNIHNKYKHDITIANVIANGNEQVAVKRKNGEYSIELNKSQKNITIDISGFIYSDPAYINYEYKMEGEDETWKPLEGKSEISYYDLSSGDYTLLIRRAGEPYSQIKVKISLPSNILLPILLIVSLVGALYLLFSRVRKRIGHAGVPTVINGAPEKEVDNGHVAIETKYKTNKVSSEECRHVVEILEIHMRKNKPYTNPELKISDLATQIDTASHTLSYIFNQYLNKNYYDYINDFRIEEFKTLVNKEEYSRYTLTALAELCGFSSRASFFRYFKKSTGITPNEYTKGIGKSNE